MRRALYFPAFVIGAAFAGLVAGAAQAHSPYLLPSAFDVTDRKLVTVQGAFTESFFSPEVVMKSDAWAVVGPDGGRKPLTAVNLRELALVVAGQGDRRGLGLGVAVVAGVQGDRLAGHRLAVEQHRELGVLAGEDAARMGDGDEFQALADRGQGGRAGRAAGHIDVGQGQALHVDRRRSGRSLGRILQELPRALDQHGLGGAARALAGGDPIGAGLFGRCLLYTSDAADE